MAFRTHPSLSLRWRSLPFWVPRATAVVGMALLLTGCAGLSEGPAESFLPEWSGDNDTVPSQTQPSQANQAQEGEPTIELSLPELTARVEENLGLRPRPQATVPEPPEPEGETSEAEAPQEQATEPPKDSDQPEDFWATFRDDLAMERVDHHQVDAFVRFYRTHEAYLNRVFERGRPFLPYIASKLKARDMPADLALLPVVESAFRPFAYSSGRAAGIWQFTPGTGRHFDLAQNWWYDGRRDVLAATEAALDYLERLHARYDSWLLALAAYNAGPGRVNSAIRRNEYRGEPTDFWSLDLPRETRGYVPKLIALSHVLRSTEEYGIELPAVPNRPGFAVVELEAPLDLARAAEMAGTDTETLYRLNPGLNQWSTPPDGPQRLMVPRDRAERFRERLAELDPKERVRWVRHRIESGETLSEIASQYRTRIKVVKEVNELTGNRITAGEHLLIPTASSQDREYALSRPQRRAATRSSGPDGRTRIMHEVGRGDSLSEIAHRYQVDTDRLAEWNDMAPGDTLHAGERLAVWVPEGDGDRSSKVRYQVRQGDSLWSIAQQFNVAVQRLRSWNGLGEDPIIRPGDRLTIYVNPTKLAEHRG